MCSCVLISADRDMTSGHGIACMQSYGLMLISYYKE